MKTKRFILMMLVMLGSVTGAWAQQRPAPNQIFYTTTDGQKIGIARFWWNDIESHTYEDGLGIITCQESIVSIHDEFREQETLQTVRFGNALETIEGMAFDRCGNLKEVDLGGAVQTISHSAFSECGNLESVRNGNSVKTIETFAFIGCKKLKHIEMGENVETIGLGAFIDSKLLTEIILGENISSIGDYAFSPCEIHKFVCKAPSPPAMGTDPFRKYWEFVKFVPYAHIGAYQADATWGGWDVMPYGELLDESVYAISASIAPLLSVAKKHGVTPDIQTYMEKICTATELSELRSNTKECVEAIGRVINRTNGPNAYTVPTGRGMRLKVTKKNGNVYEFKTQDVESVDYQRVIQ